MTPLRPSHGSGQNHSRILRRYSNQQSLKEHVPASNLTVEQRSSSQTPSPSNGRAIAHRSSLTPQKPRHSTATNNSENTVVGDHSEDNKSDSSISEIFFDKQLAPQSVSHQSNNNMTLHTSPTTRKLRSRTLHKSASKAPSQSYLSDHRAPPRQLRPRTIFQPYTKAKEDRKRQDHGKAPLSKEYGGGVQLGATPSSSKVKTIAQNRSRGTANSKPNTTMPTPPRTQRASISGESAPISIALSDDEKYHATTIYVTLASPEDGDEDSVPIPLYLSDYTTCQALFDGLCEVFGLGIQDRPSIIVTFPWRNDQNNKIRLLRSLESSFEKLREEVRDAPCWGDSQGEVPTKKCEIEMKVKVRYH